MLVRLEAGLFEDDDQAPGLVALYVRARRLGGDGDEGGVQGRGRRGGTLAGLGEGAARAGG